jgi:hypothetical protein
MVLEILRRTPVWVYALFAALVFLGATQTRTRSVPLARLLLLPMVMVGFSAFGVLGAFGGQPAPLAGWLVSLAATALVIAAVRHPGGSVYAQERYRVPGSWIPFVVIMATFFCRYAITVSLAIVPELRQSSAFAAVAGLLYGLSSGFFVGRAATLLRLRKGATPPVA